MAASKSGAHTSSVRHHRTGEEQRSKEHEAPKPVRATKTVAGEDDYNGMPLEEWKAALKKDVEERFGPTPDNLVPAGKAGW